MNRKQILVVITLGIALPSAVIAGEPRDLKQRILSNETAHIPPQCYTKTQDEGGRARNPCYVCHTRARRPNYVNDQELQLGYDFPLPAQTNPWANLFKNRTEEVAAIDDDQILDYIGRSNYLDAEGRIKPALRLASVPAKWDYNEDGRWEGFVPDAWLDFDEEGFDRDPSGALTGWRAFAYYAFPGTFWPTNGSTSDVLIRLAEPFRRNLAGERDLTAYKTNLAILEAMIREADVPISEVDEAALGGVDLDKDGRIATAKLIKYDWAPLEGRHMWYVGQALEAQRAGNLHLASGLYPEGTEFLHTVRYIDMDEEGANRLAARIKEVRYARKRHWMTYARLEAQAAAEAKEKHDFPDRLRVIRGNMEAGVSNAQGWTYAGMIEDAEGELRPQSYEELAFCVGCHSGIGATTDSSFSFPRKLPPGSNFRQGWYHWSQKDLRGLPERLRSDGEPEYGFYLHTNGAGDEYRHNREIFQRFFDASGHPNPQMLERLRGNISTLLYTSRERALQLNKAYRLIVREQGFVEGRDPTIAPARNVHQAVAGGTATGIDKPVPGF